MERGKPSGFVQNNRDNSKNPKIASFSGDDVFLEENKSGRRERAHYSFFPLTDRPDTYTQYCGIVYYV